MYKKDIFKFLGILIFSIFIISINGVNFSALFIVASTWIIYLSTILNKVAKIIDNRHILRISKVYKNLVIIFILSVLVIESILIVSISQFKEVNELEKMDYIIVLGAGLDGYKVGKVLKSRLDKAIEYYNLNNDVKIIVSGGQGEDELISEAEAMYKYLISKGIYKEKIIKEDKATTTLENIKFSKQILINRNDEDKKVLIVTNEFHLTRAMIIGNILGVKNEGLASATPIRTRVNYLIREYPTMIIDLTRTALFKLFTKL